MREQPARRMSVSAPLRILFAAGVWAFVFAYTPPANASDPIGHFDVLAAGVAYGWAYDADQPGTALNVDFYADGPAGEGVYLDTAVADQPRPDLVGTPYEDHAFAHPLPSWIIDGGSHTIYAHAGNVGP